MACPKCGCKTTYGYCDGGDDVGPADEDLERCAACGHIFLSEDHTEEDDDDYPETQPGAAAFDGADVWNAYGACDTEEHEAGMDSMMQRTFRRPIGMPDYTPEQKASAFDALWEACGLGMGMLKDYVSRDISRPGCPPNEATILRVPRYEFTILSEGEMPRFRDVLHHLATRKGG